MKLRKILVANRGEIARRVMRTASELGAETLAVHSPHDRSALFVREATRSVELRGNSPLESYLDQDQVLHAAKLLKADAIHPGYGFLSENAEFAARVERENIAFIGPTPEAIRELGDKTTARALARRLGVPTPSGTTTAITSLEEARATATEIGYPILLKAAAGGGGKGMRVVEREADLEGSLLRAQGEARTAFGDDRVYVEKYIASPRHIEFQMLADSHGSVIHLGERECSLQRRHQKLVEEAPAPMMTEQLRKEMGQAAVALLSAAKYRGAGTVEFLVDSTGKFYFLEVNTRLQVEHPITECITGLDLVREQIRIAEGERLTLQQADVTMRGHSIEVRIQAEDVWTDFLPSMGKISYVRHPGGAYVRNDSSLYAGLEISGFYDSLLSKLVVWDMTRAAAIDRMRRALEEMRIVGVSTTIPFGRFTMENARFQSGDLSTAFIAEEFGADARIAFREKLKSPLVPHFAAAASHLREQKDRNQFVSRS